MGRKGNKEGSVRLLLDGRYECMIQSKYLNPKTGKSKRIKRKDGKNVNNVATVAPQIPANISKSDPKSALVQPPTKPTNATIMINGPGVVSPKANPSIICAGFNHA